MGAQLARLDTDASLARAHKPRAQAISGCIYSARKRWMSRQKPTAAAGAAGALFSGAGCERWSLTLIAGTAGAHHIVSFFDTIVSYLVGLGKPGYNILAHEHKWRSTAKAATDDAVRSSERGLS